MLVLWQVQSIPPSGGFAGPVTGSGLADGAARSATGATPKPAYSGDATQREERGEVNRA